MPNTKKLRKLLLPITLVLLACSAYAYVFKVDSLRPAITVVYDESVNLLNITLKDSNGGSIELEGEGLPTGYRGAGYVFEYTPIDLLEEKEYALALTAEDVLKNKRTQSWKFVIELLPVKIKLIQPPFGYSPVLNYDVVIETNRAVSGCKYDLRDFSYQTMQFKFVKIADNRLQVLNISGDQTFYVRCNDSFGMVDQKSTRLDLKVDQSPPEILRAYAEPSLIIEEIDNALQTTLHVETDDKTVCKYSNKEGRNYTFMNLDGKNDVDSGLFDGNNESESSTYSPSNNVLLRGFDNREHNYNVSCRNLAGLTSTIETISFSVNLNFPLTITVESPQEVTNRTDVLIKIKTNKKAKCFYGNESNETTIPLSTSDSYTHQKTAFNLKEGTYTYYLYCTHTGQDAEKTVSFKVDLTKPSTPEVSAEDYVCPSKWGLYDISASWEAEDNLSGIDYYQYAIGSTKGGTNILNWRRGSDEEEADDLNLTNYSSIYWAVKAVDQAGNTGGEGYSSSISVLDSSDADCTSSGNCNNKKKDASNDETDIDCGGINCPKCGLNKTCSIDRDCLSGRCVYDENLKKKVCKPADHCSDGIKNEDETDVDCGGDDCDSCDKGKKCKVNADCKSNNCENGICTEATCLDGKKNGRETGIDCGGGTCPGCDDGEGCKTHADCLSRRCENEVCMEATCSDGLEDGYETAVDCGGPDCPGCEIGSQCKYDSDCLSNYCYRGYCENASKRDSDYDGMPDDWEKKYADCAKLDPLNPDDAALDADEDGLTNLQEYQYNTDPCNPDADGDGYSDGKEVALGYDPADAESHPKSSLLKILLIIFIILVLAAVGYFVGYPQLKKYLELKKPRGQRPVTRPSFTRPAVQKPRVSPEEIRKKKEEHERFLARMKEKEEKRKDLFSTFGKKAEEAKKPEQKKELGGLAEREEMQKEWVPLSDILAKKGPKEKGVFEKLAEIPKVKKTEEKKKTAFEKLGEVSKTKKTEKPAFKKLEELAKAKKQTKSAPIEELKKIAKPKRAAKGDAFEKLSKVARKKKQKASKK